MISFLEIRVQNFFIFFHTDFALLQNCFCQLAKSIRVAKWDLLNHKNASGCKGMPFAMNKINFVDTKCKWHPQELIAHLNKIAFAEAVAWNWRGSWCVCGRWWRRVVWASGPVRWTIIEDAGFQCHPYTTGWGVIPIKLISHRVVCQEVQLKELEGYFWLNEVVDAFKWMPLLEFAASKTQFPDSNGQLLVVHYT